MRTRLKKQWKTPKIKSSLTIKETRSGAGMGTDMKVFS